MHKVLEPVAIFRGRHPEVYSTCATSSVDSFPVRQQEMSPWEDSHSPLGLDQGGLYGNAPRLQETWNQFLMQHRGLTPVSN